MKTSKNHTIVTGAGGSIGSKLCETILRESPKINIIIIDHSEFHLFEIYEYLKIKYKKSNIIPILSSLQDVNELKNLIITFDIKKIYNTAAYKHVNMVENNKLNGIKNNLSILRTILEAVKVSLMKIDMIHVSTDKAVNPINMMGFTKRVCELFLENNNEFFKCLKILRFGNVLESNGSVIPIFKAQIKKGGPVTVTSFKATRYFMTIPQACNLIVTVDDQIKKNGTYILDMGTDQLIIDLAKKLITDSGHDYSFANEHGKIQIIEIGLRPGEKECESLTSGKLIQTKIANVFQAVESNNILDKEIVLKLKTNESAEKLYKALTNIYDKNNA
jgi:FlaA1/EpsC-like NDP-sugar epimerase